VEAAGQAFGVGELGEGLLVLPGLLELEALAEVAVGLGPGLPRDFLPLVRVALGLGLRAELQQLAVDVLALLDRLLALLDVEAQDGAVHVARLQVADAQVVVREVVDELHAVGPGLDRGVRLEADRLLELGKRVRTATLPDEIEALEVVLVPLAGRAGGGRDETHGQGRDERHQDALHGESVPPRPPRRPGPPRTAGPGTASPPTSRTSPRSARRARSR